MKKPLIILTLLIISFLPNVSAQLNDSLLIKQLITEIASMQYKNEAEYHFHKGMFYSYKRWEGLPHRYSPDNNIFYTGIIAFALQNMLPSLNAQNRILCIDIISRATSSYSHYKNRRNLPSYFFSEGGSPVMPNTLFVYKLSSKIAISEDIDDSIMLLMTKETPDSSIQKLKLMMDSVANGKRQYIRNTYKKYKHIPAHTTYLGKKMRVDFDMAVHCNVLYFLLEKKISFNQHDSATLEIVKEIVKNREYLSDPKFISPYYISSPVILYHLARLMGKFKIPELELYRKQIVTDIKAELQQSNNRILEIILSTSLLRLGEPAEILPVNLEDFNNSNQKKFVFYQARAASQMGNPLKRIFINFNPFNYSFYCVAYNKVLLLEYLVEKGRNVTVNR